MSRILRGEVSSSTSDQLTILSPSTGFVSETILNELDAKKRTSLCKYFVKLAVSATSSPCFCSCLY